MKRVISVVAAVAVGVLAWAGPAAAYPAGNQRFTVIFSGAEEAPGRVVASGVVNGVGTDVTVSQDDSTTVDEITFPGQGTLFVTINFDPGPEPSFDSRSCVSRFSGTGTLTVTGGTGRFVGASGTGSVSLKGIFVGRRTAQGCSEEGGRSFVVATVNGTLHLAGAAAA